MKWIYSIRNKMTASIVLFILCFMIIVNNLTERKQVAQVRNKLSSMYNDRLIAESYILKLSTYMHQIIEHTNAADINYLDEPRIIDDIMLRVNKVNIDYGNTMLTVEEEKNFIAFKNICDQIENVKHSSNTQSINELSKDALTILYTLSDIQLEESQLIIANSDKIFSADKLSSEFEMAIVVIIAFVLQAFVFTSKSLFVNTRTANPYLN